MAEQQTWMHDGQLSIDTVVVQQLIAEQFPHWSSEPVVRLHTDATVNSIFRIGQDFTARFPLTGADPESVQRELTTEAAAMRSFAAQASFAAPVPLAIGPATADFPLPWSVQSWVPGVVATPRGLASSLPFAQDLAELITSLRQIDTAGRGFAGNGRGGELRDHDEWMELCLERSEDLLPVAQLRLLWARLRQLPRDGADVMSHTDLTPANLLVEGERLVGVLDTGGFQPADSALDLVAAWHLFDADVRARFRELLACDEVEWMRGQAWALEQAMGLVWYYRTSNPGMAALGRSTIARILDETGSESDR